MSLSFDHRLAAVALGAAAVIEALVRGDDTGTRLMLSVLLALATTVPVGWLTEHWVVPVTIVLAAAASLIVEPGLTIAGFATLIVAFFYVARHIRASLVLALIVPLALVAAGELLSGSGPATSDAVVTEDAAEFDDAAGDIEQPPELDEPDLYPLLVTSVCLAAAGLGFFQRTRLTEAKLQESVAGFADASAAHTARGERARIARELHDVVAHRISSIAVQAETARLTTPDLTPEGARQLVAIGDSARDALSEMRQLLGVLRKDADDTTSREPQPGITQLTQLVQEARELSGSIVRLIVSGNVEPLDPGVELTVYRIVQESLTNARRHAPGSPVDVELVYQDDTVQIQIADAGPGLRERDSHGHGLLGMRERVEAVGGDLSIQTGQSGGFTVSAELPRSVGAHHG